MIEGQELRASEVAKAEAKLDHLNTQVAAMRAVLMQLLQDVVRAEKRLDHGQAALLLQANEQLVISGLELRDEVDSTVGALDEVTRSVAVDALTRLPNRTVLMDRLEQAIAGARRHRKRVAVLFLDLNNFKKVNDRFGHAAGDRVLQEVAVCLTSLVRATDTVSRHGGDEFLVVLAEVAEAADAGLIARKVNAALRASKSEFTRGAPVTASIGISIYPDDGEDAAALIASADAAMYLAKETTDGGFAFHAQVASGGPAGVSAFSPADVHAVAPAVAPSRPRPSPTQPQQQIFDEHERRHAQLVQANEQLVLVALGFEALKDAADSARQRRADLLDAVVQELSNPLAPVRIAGDLSGQEHVYDALLPRAVAIVERQMLHMAQAVNALLEPVQGSPPQLPGRRGIDMVQLARAVVEDCRAAIANRHQALDVRLPAGAIGVHGDPVQLAQVLAQLLRNASEFTPDGGQLGLRVEPAGAQVQLMILDDGMGIEADALSTMLQPFVRDPRLPYSSDDSFGLGLTSVRAVIEAHGGSLAAFSAGAGRGSQFTILLPMVALPDQG